MLHRLGRIDRVLPLPKEKGQASGLAPSCVTARPVWSGLLREQRRAPGNPQLAEQTAHDAVEQRILGRLVQLDRLAREEAPADLGAAALDDFLAGAVGCEQIAR